MWAAATFSPRLIASSFLFIGVSVLFRQRRLPCGRGGLYWAGRARQRRMTGAAQIFFERPFAAAAGLAGDYEVQTGHEGDVLSSGTGLVAGMTRDGCGTASWFGR